ncbi:Long chain fatty acid acyl-CoA ligase [Ceraceosorus bombacis]|uniref:Long chain fatty acid acyl-CoA ligase n=1 Tax=Ceraceosorus bombacis TaxID=401625 RepID=A0A0P1BQ27_9BASI|nr:Long chain fatty acid acyl-CoA ligase [Ceraceosorus bombacis]
MSFIKPQVVGASYLLPTLIDHSAQVNASQPFRIDRNSDGRWVTTTHATFAALVSGAAWALGDLDVPHRRDSAEPPVLAMLTGSDLASVVGILGAIKRGCAVLMLSPRCPPETIIALLSSSNAQCLFFSPKHRALAERVRQVSSCKTLQLPSIEGITAASNRFGHFPYEQSHDNEVHKTCIILHSSGSTGTPKLCPHSHKDILNHGLVIAHPNDAATTSDKRGLAIFNSLPLFHAMGWLAGPLGSLLAGLKPAVPAADFVPTPESIAEHIRSAGCKAAILVPSLVDDLASDIKTRDVLSGLTVWWGGAPMSDATYSRMLEAGATSLVTYGLTETTSLGHSHDIPPPGQEALDGRWIVLRSDMDYEFEAFPLEDAGPQLYELVVKSTPACSVISETAPGKTHTGDLVEKHPTWPNAIRVHGRKSDMVILANGENVATTPLEMALSSHPWVLRAVVVGEGYSHASVLIEPRKAYRDKSLDEFRQAVWPIVKKANAKAPAYAQIFAANVMLTERTKPLPVSEKGTVQRKRAVELYKKEIAALYSESRNDEDNLTAPTNLSRGALKTFVHVTVARVLDLESLELGGVQRQAAVLKSRGIDETLAHSAKLIFVDGTADDLSVDALPERPDLIIHSAWPVRFDLPLKSFESSIAGVRNLLQLSVALQARFVFISSIAAGMQTQAASDTSRHCQTRVIAEDKQVELEWALGGYGASKQVGERLISSAVKANACFEGFSIRCGQLMGDEKSGQWNESEWWPSIVRSAGKLGCLPEDSGLGIVDWITHNDAARSIVGLSIGYERRPLAATPQSSTNVVNLVHPKVLASASRIFADVMYPQPQIVPLVEWLDMLNQLQSSAKDDKEYTKLTAEVPALALLDFYKQRASACQAIRYEVGEANNHLANAKVLDAPLARVFTKAWGLRIRGDA